MKAIEAFTNAIQDLVGDKTIGIPKEQVDKDFRNSIYDTGTKCFLCGNTASYKLIPKSDRYNSAQIQDRGFVCKYCLQHNPNISNTHFGIREIK